MLVLSRQAGEAIVIGRGADAVRVVVVEIRGDKVKLGFVASETVPIHREEVHSDMVRKGAVKSLGGLRGTGPKIIQLPATKISQLPAIDGDSTQ